MQMSESHELWIALQLSWVIIAIVWFLRRNDELPGLVSIFLLYVGSFRLVSTFAGWGAPVDLGGYFQVADYASFVEALRLITIGESVFLIAYLLFQKSNLHVPRFTISERLTLFLKPNVILFALGAIPFALFCRWKTDAAVQQNRSLAFEVSGYMYLFPLVLVSVVILLLILWKGRGLRTMTERTTAVLLMTLAAYLTYSPTGRFQFVGWVVAATIILVSDLQGLRRALAVMIGLCVALGMFAAAGALRTIAETNPDSDATQSAWERFISAEDANMLDGMALLQQVYPDLLPYSRGQEHLEVLLRPIPRKLWPEKPVGGYMNKLGITSADAGFTVGISPTVFGSFYAEGGFFGIILLAFIYGAAFGTVVSSSTKWGPCASVLVRAIICAWMIPLLRGGDLANIYSWLGMAFWPCFLLLWIKRRELFAQESTQLKPALSHLVEAPHVG